MGLLFMPIPWGIVISLIVLGFAFFIRHVIEVIIEEDEVFFAIIGVFLLVYIGAAIAVGTLNPVELVRDHVIGQEVDAEEVVTL